MKDLLRDLADRSAVASPPWKILLTIACVITFVASCTGAQDESPSSPSANDSGSTPSVQRVRDYETFTIALESAGHTVRAGSVKKLTGFEGFIVPGRIVSIDGVRVWAFEYPTTAASEKMRSSISKDGHAIGDVLIDWTPHIYGAGRLIVVHLGDRQSTIRTLDQLLGPQFAGA